jgi:hypothetical protein
LTLASQLFIPLLSPSILFIPVDKDAGCFGADCSGVSASSSAVFDGDEQDGRGWKMG